MVELVCAYAPQHWHSQGFCWPSQPILPTPKEGKTTRCPEWTPMPHPLHPFPPYYIADPQKVEAGEMLMIRTNHTLKGHLASTYSYRHWHLMGHVVNVMLAVFTSKDLFLVPIQNGSTVEALVITGLASKHASHCTTTAPFQSVQKQAKHSGKDYLLIVFSCFQLPCHVSSSPVPCKILLLAAVEPQTSQCRQNSG